MSEIRITAGAWETGIGAYEAGLLHLPNGEVRGFEDLADLSVKNGSEPQGRRAGLFGGLRSALHAAGPLPRPLDLAASVVGLGLGVIGGDLHAQVSLQARFSDGASAVILTDPATAASMIRDREMIRLALQRRDASRPGHADQELQERREMSGRAILPAPDAERDADRALTSIFEYEMRKGRLRRLAAAKSPDEA